jgi:hypothetical protein
MITGSPNTALPPEQVPDLSPIKPERRIRMFARIVEFIPKLEKKEELVKVIRTEVLPILKKQTGFLEVLPFFPDVRKRISAEGSLPSAKASGLTGHVSVLSPYELLSHQPSFQPQLVVC